MKILTRCLMLSILIVCLSTSCGNEVETGKETSETKELEQKTVELSTTNPFVKSIQKAHKVANLLEKDVISFDLELYFGGRKSFAGTIATKTNSSKIRMTRKEDNASLLFDGEGLYIYPDTATWKGARFSIFTYQYFFMAPFKFHDEGTVWEETGEMTLNTLPYDTGKLSFKQDIGDAPDDWYWVYKNKKTNLVDAMAYIVTGSGRTQEEAEKRASSIIYTEYQSTFNIPISSKWEFYKWSKEEDIYGDQRGYAHITNVQLFEEEGDIFDLPEGKKNVKLEE